MQHNLSFEQAPPISVPYRFFLTAPLFGVFAGLVLAWLGPPALASRWTPAVLALTHLIVAGFMLQVMCGALLQFVAVVAGANIWRPRLVAAVVHPLITLGGLSLAAAFLLGVPVLFIFSALAFALGLGLFLAVMAIALLRTSATGMSIRVLRLALLGLLTTAVFGVILSAALGGHGALQGHWSLMTLVDIHLAWGLGGWALMLVMGVSFMVVPMFQLTPAYPGWLTRTVPPGLFGILCLWSMQLLPGTGEAQPWQSGVALTGMILAGVYAVATLSLQSRRRRRQTDVTFTCWRSAMAALAVLSFSWLLFKALPQLSGHARMPLWLGMLALGGTFVPVITGMLYKIMPFLNWLHLQQTAGTLGLAPNMKQMIPPRMMHWQMRLQFGALTLLLAAVIWPLLSVPAGLLFAVSCLWLEGNLISATRVFLHCRDQIRAPSGPSGHEGSFE